VKRKTHRRKRKRKTCWKRK